MCQQFLGLSYCYIWPGGCHQWLNTLYGCVFVGWYMHARVRKRLCARARVCARNWQLRYPWTLQQWLKQMNSLPRVIKCGYSFLPRVSTCQPMDWGWSPVNKRRSNTSCSHKWSLRVWNPLSWHWCGAIIRWFLRYRLFALHNSEVRYYHKIINCIPRLLTSHKPKLYITLTDSQMKIKINMLYRSFPSIHSFIHFDYSATTKR